LFPCNKKNDTMMGIEWNEEYHERVVREGRTCDIRNDDVAALVVSSLAVVGTPLQEDSVREIPFLNVLVVLDKNSVDSRTPRRRSKTNNLQIMKINPVIFQQHPREKQRPQDKAKKKKKKRKKNQRKGVRFESHLHIKNWIDPAYDTLKEIFPESLWWTREERLAMVAREEATVLRCHGGARQRHLKELWEICSKDQVDNREARNSSRRETRTTKKNTAISTSLSDLFRISNSLARGLEDDLLPSMQKHQQNAVQMVLKIQKELEEDPPSVRARIIKERYEEMSRTAARFARAIGAGDASVAEYR